MAAPKLHTTLRRFLNFTKDFAQYRVVYNCCAASRCQTFSTSKTSIFDEDNTSVKKQQRPKTVPIPKITLISLDGSITVTELEDAQRLAKRRNLTLIKGSDTEDKAQRSVYKLVSNSTLIDEIEHEKIIEKKKEKSKGIKIFYISARITEHDLQTKLRNAVKSLKKDHKVKIVLTLNDDNSDSIKSIIETTLKNDGNIQQMPSKKNVLLLLITPLSKDKDNSVDSKEENNISETIS